MAQHPIIVQNGSGLDVRDGVNKALETLATGYAGAVQPNQIFPYMWWIDTQNSLIKQATADASQFVRKGILLANGTVQWDAAEIVAPASGNLPAGTVASQLAALDATVGANPSLRNKIINGNFNIWQRGTTSISGGYLADRWAIRSPVSVGGIQTVSRQPFPVGQTEVPGNPKYFHRINAVNATSNTYMYQRIEDVATLSGNLAILSFYARYSIPQQLSASLIQGFGSGGSPSNSFAGFNFTPTTSWKEFAFPVLVPGIAGKTIGANNYLQLQIGTVGIVNGDLDFAQVQLEEGSVATLFEQRHIQQELALCQRYYEKSYDIDTVPGTLTNYGEYITADSFGGSVYSVGRFKVEKRAAPIIKIRDRAGTLGNVTTFTGGGISTNRTGSVSQIVTSAFNVSATTTSDIAMVFQYEADAEL
jgi:hypothetical protein